MAMFSAIFRRLDCAIVIGLVSKGSASLNAVWKLVLSLGTAGGSCFQQLFHQVACGSVKGDVARRLRSRLASVRNGAPACEHPSCKSQSGYHVRLAIEHALLCGN